MLKRSENSRSLAETITRSASKQTYYTIRFFVDRGFTAHAYRAYAYFRWLDDILDAEEGTIDDRLAFLNRQQELLEACYHGAVAKGLSAEEEMLFDLVSHDRETNSGLHTYLRNMMAVMAFDVERRGRVVSQGELDEYSRLLATAVTEVIYYFIGHGDPQPPAENRYLAVTAAHIVHMLRDAYEDTTSGYYNIPGEYLQQHGISVQDVESTAYRRWVCGRLQLARQYFKQSRESHAHIKSLRCRLASRAYMARFEWILHTIERENYCLRRDYSERKSLAATLWMLCSVLHSLPRFSRQKASFRT